MLAIVKNKGQWINSKHMRTYVFNTKRNETETRGLRQDRCEYNPSTKVATLQYFTDSDWISERHAKLQMEKYMRSNITQSRMFCCVDNMKTSRTKGLSTRVQILWLTNKEPSEEEMNSIVERIMQLPMTAQFKVEEMNYYERLKLTGTTKEDDGTLEPASDDYIKNCQERGFF